MTRPRSGRREAALADVAAAAGVSESTASRALRDLPNVAAPTRERVREAARRLGYRPDPFASRLAVGTTGTIAAVGLDYDHWDVMAAIGGVARVVAANGRDLVLAEAPDESARRAVLGAGIGKRVDGVVLVGIDLGADAAVGLASSTSVASVGIAIPGVVTAMTDNRAAAAAAVDLLASYGHTRIAFVDASHGAPWQPVRRRRLIGYRRALQRRALGWRAELEVRLGPGAHGDGRTFAAMRALPDPPTAVVAATDLEAFRVRAWARTAGLDVPRDLSVVGIDDHPLAASEGLTSVSTRLADQGALAATLLLRGLGGTTHHELVHHVPATIVERASVGTAPGRS